MEMCQNKIVRSIGEFFLLSLLSLTVPGFVFIDSVIIGDGVGESSITEFVQETLLMVSAMCFGYAAWRHKDSRGFFVLIAGFFSCLLVRELDSFFDNFRHGFWFWPALLVALISITYVMVYCRDTVLGAMADFVDSRPYFFIIFGLVIVLVFSRVFGSGEILWKHMMTSDYENVYKRALQEGLELLGYIYIAYGTFLTLWDKRSNDSLLEKSIKQAETFPKK
jgi:hypothetical protein